MRILTILLLLTSCLSEAQIDKKKLFLLQSVNTPEIPWWLGKTGSVTESTNYTVYDPLAAPDLATSYLNLANPGTRDADAPVAAPTHAQGSGWTFNGSTQYLRGPVITFNHTIIVWVENSAGVYAFGTYSSGTNIVYARPVSSTSTAMRFGNAVSLFAGTTVGGILAVNQSRLIKDKILLSAPSSPWVSGTNNNRLGIGCDNAVGTYGNFFNGRILRLAIYDFILSEAQINDVMDGMYNYNQPTVNSYSASILALNPIAYYPCNQSIGSVCLDHSGNNAHSEVNGLSVGQSGPFGNSIAGNGNANNSFRTISGTAASSRIWANRTGIDIDNYWFSVLIKINSDGSNQVRILNQYANSGAEYFALECRNGTQLSIFSRENGVNQNTAVLANIVDGEWMHIVAYNSLSTGKMGIYLNGTKYEVTKTNGGFFGLIDDLYPLVGQDLDGNFQHIAFFNGVPTQEQVDSINPFQ